MFQLHPSQEVLELIREYGGVDTEYFISPEGRADDISLKAGLELGYNYFWSSRARRITEATSPTDVPRVSDQWPLAQVLWDAARLK